MIKVKKLFDDDDDNTLFMCQVSPFLLKCFLKEIENMSSVFLSSYRKTRESLGELEKSCGNTHLQLVFPQHSLFSYLCFYNSTETQYMYMFSVS